MVWSARRDGDCCIMYSCECALPMGCTHQSRHEQIKWSAHVEDCKRLVSDSNPAFRFNICLCMRTVYQKAKLHPIAPVARSLIGIIKSQIIRMPTFQPPIWTNMPPKQHRTNVMIRQTTQCRQDCNTAYTTSASHHRLLDDSAAMPVTHLHQGVGARITTSPVHFS